MSAFTQGALVYQSLQIVTSNTNTALSANANSWIVLTGTQDHIITMPDATLNKQGKQYVIINRSSGAIKIRSFTTAPITTVAPYQDRSIYLIDNSTSSGSWEILSRYESTVPFKLSETMVPSSQLVIGSNRVVMPDGSAVVTPPADGSLDVSPVTSIDLLSGATTGAPVTLEGGVFSLPSIPVGNFIRCCISYTSGSNAFDIAFGDAQVSTANLENPAQVFKKAAGRPVGYLDLESVGPSQYKTPGATTNVIQNQVNYLPTIFNISTPVSGDSESAGDNYVINSKMEIGVNHWTAVGTVALSTTNNPVELLGEVRSLKIVKDATAPTSDYAVGACYRLNPVDLTRLQYVYFDYKDPLGSNILGDWSVTIFDKVNLTDIFPIVDDIPAGEGTFKYSWVPDPSSNDYEIRVHANTASRELVIDNVYLGPKPFTNDYTDTSELIYNSDTTNADDTTSFQTGPLGSLVPTVSGSNKYKLVRFGTNFQAWEQVVAEVQPPLSSHWMSAASVFPRVTATTGVWVEPSGASTTDLLIYFGASGGNSTDTWATLNAAGWKWRVRKPGYIGTGQLVPATKDNAGYMVQSNDSSPQTFAGAKQWYDSTGSGVIIEWDDSGIVNVPGVVTFGGAKGVIPVGGVVPIFNNIAGSYALPASGTVSAEGWMRCDGSIIPGGNALTGNTPDITNSTFILGTDNTGSGVVPQDNPLSGTAGGSNGLSTPAITVNWNSAIVNTTFTDSTWAGGGTFLRSDFDANNTAHTHDLSNHTHSATHSHLMKHVHKFVIWKASGTGNYSLQYQQNGLVDYSEIMSTPEDVIANIDTPNGTGGTIKLAQVVNQTSGTDLEHYTAGVTGDNGDGNAARTASESVLTGPPSPNSTSSQTVSFTGSQTVGVTGANSSGSATFNKTEMNSNQVAHVHTVTDTRPKYISAVYLIRVN